MFVLNLLQPVPQALPDAAPVDAVTLANGAAPAAAAHADKGLDILGLVLHLDLPPLPIAAGWLTVTLITLGAAWPAIWSLGRRQPRELLAAVKG